MNNTEIATKKPESLERLAMSSRIIVIANAVEQLGNLDQLKMSAEEVQKSVEIKTTDQIGALAQLAENRAEAKLESVISADLGEPKANLATQPNTLVSDALTVETALARVWEAYNGQSAEWN
jgi:hypothetical protein